MMFSEDQVAAVDRLQRYIAHHLKSTITLFQLSQIAGYSPSYTSSIFKDIMGINLFDYIRKMRLTEAAKILRDTPDKTLVLDVALDFVFDSHEGFTRAFTKAFGTSPKKYRQNPNPIPMFLPYSASELHNHQQKGAHKMSTTINAHTESTTPVDHTIFVQVIDKPMRKLLMLRGTSATHYFEYCEEVGCDVWGVLTSVKEALGEPMGLWLPPSLIRTGTSSYVQGVELPLDYSGPIPKGYDLITLEPCQMMIFQGPPYDDENFGQAIDDLWNAISRYNPLLYGFEWNPEFAPRFQLAPQGYRGYIEGRPVKRIAL